MNKSTRIILTLILLLAVSVLGAAQAGASSPVKTHTKIMTGKIHACNPHLGKDDVIRAALGDAWVKWGPEHGLKIKKPRCYTRVRLTYRGNRLIKTQSATRIQILYRFDGATGWRKSRWGIIAQTG